jgi:23S rRNA G2445 N2-methylase RlmL
VRFFATAAKGTEPALRDELRELRFPKVRADRGGVHFEGDFLEGFRACLTSRVALRVLAPVAEFECPDEDALYEGVKSVDWSEFLTARQTLAVSAACKSSRLTHTQYLAQRTKDAIVDQQRERAGARSSVDLRDPDVRVFVHLVKDVARIFLDLAGESLHRRGYRLEQGEAPLKENLAAAVLRFSGWDRETPFFDPMCGSGTLLVEAASAALGRAPGIDRERFGIERWANADHVRKRAFKELRDELRSKERREAPTVFGSDVDRAALDKAQKNARRARVKIELVEGKLKDFERPGPGAIVTNPPYGKRLAAPGELARELARLVDRHPDHHVALLMAAEQPLGHTRRAPESIRAVYNGDIECQVRTYAPIRRDARPL